MYDIVPPDPYKPRPSAPQVVVGGNTAPPQNNPIGQASFFMRIRQLVGANPMLWLAAGICGLALIGGGSFYLVSNHKQTPKPVATVETNKTNENKQTTGAGTDTQTTPQDTPAANTPQTDPNKKTSTNTSSGGGTSSQGGSTGGGGSTPHGPIALKIMPLGDSITQGGVGDPQTINGYRLELWNNLGSAYQIDYVGSWQNGNSQLSDKDLNGFSGNCIKTDPCHGDVSLYSQTAGWINTEHPDLVIMQGGGNDFVDPTMTETKVETYMEDWISLVFATKPGVKIIVTGAPGWYPNYSAALETYVNQQKAAGKPIRYVTYDNVDTVDGTHPSLAGFVTWGDALAGKVRELFP